MTLRHGYFSDQGYTFGAYPETSPERLGQGTGQRLAVTPGSGWQQKLD